MLLVRNACWCCCEEGSRAALVCKVKAHSDGWTCANTSDRNMRLVSGGWEQPMKKKGSLWKFRKRMSVRLQVSWKSWLGLPCSSSVINKFLIKFYKFAGTTLTDTICWMIKSGKGIQASLRMFCSLIHITASLFSTVYWEHISQSCLGDIRVLCWNVNIAAVLWPDLLNVHEDKQKQHHISWVFFMDFFFLWGNKMIHSEATHRIAEFCPLL